VLTHGAATSDQKLENRTRLVLVDEISLFRASLAHFLASEPGFEVVGECGTCAEALEVLKSSAPDVVLLDFEIGAEQGADLIAASRRVEFQGHFLMVAGSADIRKSALALKAGASGVFLKSEPPESLSKAIHVIAEGGMWVDQRIIQPLAEHLINPYPLVARGEPLSRFLDERERNVLAGIVGGLTNRKIGHELGMSESQVKNIVQRLFTKSRVNTRSQLVKAALEGSLGAAQGSLAYKPEQRDHNNAVRAARAPHRPQAHNQPVV